MGEQSFERCFVCNAHTDRAGRADDSIYLGAIGPWCEKCHAEARDAVLDDARIDGLLADPDHLAALASARAEVEALRKERDALREVARCVVYWHDFHMKFATLELGTPLPTYEQVEAITDEEKYDRARDILGGLREWLHVMSEMPEGAIERARAETEARNAAYRAEQAAREPGRSGA